MPKTKGQTQFLEYKVGKIIRMIKKIKNKLQEEGLDSRDLPKLINQSLRLHGYDKDEASGSTSFQEFAIEAMAKDSNRFTTSTLLALSQTYQNLVTSLEDQQPTFTEIKKSTMINQLSPVKQQEQVTLEVKKERSIGVKLQQGLERDKSFHEQERFVRKIKKELARKKIEMKMLRHQIRNGERAVELGREEGIRREKKKSNRK